jgi:SAM-dependent methyltransferase
MANEAQIELWNGGAAAGWIEEQELLDQLFLPFENLLVDSIDVGHSRVLDVGCGTGATTLAIARRHAGNTGSLGMDVSSPMIALARQRALQENSSAEFVVADAQEHRFATDAFDAVVSRFGVMFFDDPVRAFANLLSATRSGGKLHCITFRSPAENPFMTAAESAAASLLPTLPKRQPGAPGQFAFADAGRTRTVLERAGWSSIQHQQLDVPCVMPASALQTWLTRLGPVGQMLRQVDAHRRQEIACAVTRAFDPYIHGDEIRFAAACWMLEAQAK